MINVAEILADAAAQVGVVEYDGTVGGQHSIQFTRLLNMVLYEYSIDERLNYRQKSVSLQAATVIPKGYITCGSDNPTNDITDDIASIKSITSSQANITFKELMEISYQDYLAIPVKQIVSIPSQYAYDYQDPQSKIYLFPVPNGSLNINIVYRPMLGVAASPIAQLDLPKYYTSPLVYDLACRLSPIYPSQAGFNTSLGILTKSAREDLRIRISRSSRMGVRSGYPTAGGGSSYWTSPLNNAV